MSTKLPQLKKTLRVPREIRDCRAICPNVTRFSPRRFSPLWHALTCGQNKSCTSTAAVSAAEPAKEQEQQRKRPLGGSGHRTPAHPCNTPPASASGGTVRSGHSSHTSADRREAGEGLRKAGETEGNGDSRTLGAPGFLWGWWKYVFSSGLQWWWNNCVTALNSVHQTL